MYRGRPDNARRLTVNPIATHAHAQEHIRDLHAAAERNRLVAIATRCRAGAGKRLAHHLARAREGVADWRRSGQLGPVDNYCACG
jgi:hypothetical protein